MAIDITDLASRVIIHGHCPCGTLRDDRPDGQPGSYCPGCGTVKGPPQFTGILNRERPSLTLLEGGESRPRDAR